MDYNLMQAAKITIIGGADGPTSIYIAGGSVIFTVILAVLKLLVLGTLIFFMVRAIRQKRRGRAVGLGVCLGILCLIFTVPAITSAVTLFKYKKILSQRETGGSKDFSGMNVIDAYPFEGNSFGDLDGILVIVDDKWAGMGFVFSRTDDGFFKVTQEIFGSGVPVAAECTYFGTLEGSRLSLDGDGGFFLLKDHQLRYFCDEETELQITGLEDYKSWFDGIKKSSE